MANWEHDKGVYTINVSTVRSPSELRQDMRNLEKRIEAEKKRRGL